MCDEEMRLMSVLLVWAARALSLLQVGTRGPAALGSAVTRLPGSSTEAQWLHSVPECICSEARPLRSEANL